MASKWKGGWKHYLAEHGLVLPSHKTALRGRSPTYFMRWKDRDIVEEFYIEDGYDDLSFSKYSTVIDVGAHIGLFTVRAAKCGATVHAFEPSPQSYQNLLRNLELHGVADRVIPHNTAITAATGQTEFFSSEKGSLYDSTSKSTDGTRRIVASTNLLSATETMDLDGKCLLKLDCEGSEFEIVKESPERAFHGIDSVFIEYHSSHGDADVLVGELEDLGYSVSRRSDPRQHVSSDLGFIVGGK